MVRRKSKATAAKRAVGYVRVSTDEQGQHGVSLAEQEQRIRAWADGAGLTIAAVYTDVGSGGRADNRAGLQSALADVCAAGGVLVAVSISRFARSTRDMIDIGERLRKAGADLVSLSEKIDTTTAGGIALFEMLAVFATWERNIARERTKATAKHLREQGRRISRYAPFGFDFNADGGLIVNAREQAAIARMHAWNEGGKTLREIGRLLLAEGINPKNGGATWSASVIRTVLLRERIAA